ncbi:MAG: 6,7-dimethyl-8-ribityllumazine synthase, partial [Pseudomonadales bacterium]|nr:6,7-dimethyl-8-ribityllumazine synthase [Pseudomonadales bacterium]
MSTESIDPQFANYRRPEKLQRRLDSMRCLSGRADGFGQAANLQATKIAIIVGRWHSYIVDRLLQGALNTANECGIGDAQIDIVQAPGAYEIPLVAKALAQRGNYAALVTLGAVIKGDTPHFDFVAGECARGLAAISID